MQQGVAVGIDVAKDFHWVQAVDRRDSEVLFSGRVDNTPPALAAFVEHLEGLRDRGPLTADIDVVGGIASVLTAMLLEAGIDVVHVPGLAVNRAREGTAGGEHKSTPRNAAVIAKTLLRRRDLRRTNRLASWTPRSGCSSVGAASSSATRRAASTGCATSWPRSIRAWNASWTPRPRPPSSC